MNWEVERDIYLRQQEQMEMRQRLDKLRSLQSGLEAVLNQIQEVQQTEYAVMEEYPYLHMTLGVAYGFAMTKLDMIDAEKAQIMLETN